MRDIKYLDCFYITASGVVIGEKLVRSLNHAQKKRAYYTEKYKEPVNFTVLKVIIKRPGGRIVKGW